MLSIAAIVWCSLAVVLLAAGSVAHAADESLSSEIIYRASLGRAEDIKLLVTQGASPDQKNGNGVPVIAVAAQRTDPEGVNVVNALIEIGANVNARDSKGQTALFYAAKSGNADTAHALLAGKIDAQALDANGDVALAVAKKFGHQNVVDAIEGFKAPSPEPPPATPSAATQQLPDASPPLAVKESPDVKDKDVQAMHEEMAREAEAATVESPASSAPPAVNTENVTEDKKSDLPADGTSRKEDVLKKEKMMDISVREKPPQNAADIPEQGTGDFLIDSSDADYSDVDDTSQPSEAAIAQKLHEQDELARERKESIQRLAYDIAYHTCAFQYWSFCEQVKLKTELSSEELTIAIQSHRDQVEAFQKKLLYDYKLKNAAVDKITNSSQVRIHTQLNGMASNRVRRENGIGKMDDMQVRCEEIGRQWGASVPKFEKAGAKKSDNAAPPVSSAPAFGGIQGPKAVGGVPKPKPDPNPVPKAKPKPKPKPKSQSKPDPNFTSGKAPKATGR